MAKAVKGAFKWVGKIAFGVAGFALKPIIRALTPPLPEVDTENAVNFRADPKAGVPYLIGQTATAGVYTYATVGEAKNRNILFHTVLSGGGRIDSFVKFTAGGLEVVFDGADTPESGPYRHLMWMRKQVGSFPSTALLPPNTLDAGVLAEWTSAHKTSGYSTAWYVLGADQKAYASGVPDPLWEIKGVWCYDWRQDSTFPGGAPGGTQRLNNPDSWAYTENPAVHAVQWCLGRYVNGKRVLGLGASLAQIVMLRATEWANVCDANNWKVGGVVYSTDTKWQVLKAICQAGGAYPIPLGTQISFIFNAPRVSIATLTGADIEGEPSIVGAQPRRDRYNEGVARYRSRDHGWQIVPGAPLRIAEFVTADGDRVHTKEFEWPLVQNVDQAYQLLAYGLCNSRELGPIDFPVIPKWMGLDPGDCITVNEPEFGLTSQKMVITSRSRMLMDFDRAITCVTETDSKHAFCLGQSGTPPVDPSLSAIDTLPTPPDAGDWDVTEGEVAGPGGTLPAIILIGAVTDPNAVEIIVEYREVISAGVYGPPATVSRPVTATRIEITGLRAGVRYRVWVRYRYARNTEDPVDGNTDIGEVTVGIVGAGGLGGETAASVLEGLSTQALTVAAEALRQGFWRIDNDSIVKLPGGGNIRLLQEQLGITVDGVKLFVDFQRSVDTDGNAMWALTAQNSNGRVTGIRNLLTGEGIGKLTLAADIIEAVDPDGGNPRFILRYGLDNRLILNDVYIELLEVGAVKTDSIFPQSVVVPVVTTGSSTISCDGTNKLIISHTVVLAYDAPLFVTCALSSHFPSGDKNWTATLYIDGVSVFDTGGANGEAGMFLMGAQYCAAGSRLVEVRLNSHSSVNVTSRTLSTMGPMR